MGGPYIFSRVEASNLVLSYEFATKWQNCTDQTVFLECCWYFLRMLFYCLHSIYPFCFQLLQEPHTKKQLCQLDNHTNRIDADIFYWFRFLVFLSFLFSLFGLWWWWWWESHRSRAHGPPHEDGRRTTAVFQRSNYLSIYLPDPWSSMALLF